MFSKALRIATTKAASDAEAAGLSRCLACANDLESIEAAFESRLSASKAARGEKPTPLSKSKRGQLAGYAEDAADIAQETLAYVETCTEAREILDLLHAALEGDLLFWRSVVKHAHPADQSIIEALVGAKAQLLDALAESRAIDKAASPRHNEPPSA